jgi:hypothetical protein
MRERERETENESRTVRKGTGASLQALLHSTIFE